MFYVYKICPGLQKKKELLIRRPCPPILPKDIRYIISPPSCPVIPLPQRPISFEIVSINPPKAQNVSQPRRAVVAAGGGLLKRTGSQKGRTNGRDGNLGKGTGAHNIDWRIAFSCR